MNLASEPKSTPFDLIAAKTSHALLRGGPGAHTSQRLSLPEAKYAKGKLRRRRTSQNTSPWVRVTLCWDCQVWRVRAGMLELWDARGAQDEGQAAATWLHPGG